MTTRSQTAPRQLLSQLCAATAYSEPETQLHNAIIDKIFLEILFAHIERNRPDRLYKVLDIGAGSGYALSLFSQAGFFTRGVNLLEADCQACWKRGLDCVQGDMHDLPEADADYDFVFCRHCLEHSPFPMLALSEAHRVLRDSGWLYLEVPIADTACGHETNANHWSLFPKSVWRQLLNRSGFEIIDQRDLTFMTQAGEDMYYCWLCQKATPLHLNQSM